MDKIEKTRLTDALQSSIVQLCQNAIRGCDLLCPDVEIDGLVCISVGDTEVVVKVHQKSVIEDESTDTAEEEEAAATSKMKGRKKRVAKNRRRACSNRLQVVKVDPQRELPCAMCGVSFEGYAEFKEHNWKVHQWHTCNNCYLTFESPEELNEHARLPCHVPSPQRDLLKCGVCAIESHTIDHLAAHLQQEHLFSKVVQCSLCNLYFPDTESFNEHNMREHAAVECDQVKTIVISADDPTPPQETHAIVLSPEKDNKIASKMNTGEPILFKCPICHSLESSINAYREHQQNLHNRVICHVCCHSFSAKRKLTRHFNIHLRKMPFSCQQCSLRFHKQEEMDKHVSGNFCQGCSV